MRRIGIAGILSLSLLLIGCGGGSGKTVITRFPQWDFERYERIAVLPLRTPNPHAVEAARQAGFELEHLLTGNGRFKVLSRSEVETILQEQDLSRLADTADPTTVIPAGRIQAAQALVVPTLTAYEPRAEKQIRKRPVYARDQRGLIARDRAGRPIVTGEQIIEVFRHAASVAGNVRVIDTGTGQVIFSYSTPPIERNDERQGAPPPASPEALALDAAREMASDLYANLAPVQIRVKLDSDSLVIARGYYDGRYDETTSVPTTAENFQVVVRSLPKECDRNTFRVVITEPQARRDLFDEKFIWSSGMGARGQTCTVPLTDLTSSGALKFEAKLYSADDDVPLLIRSFKLVPPKQ
jgi:hypothetical protein